MVDFIIRTLIIELDSFVEVNEPIFVREREIPDEVEQKIGKLVASLVPDGNIHNVRYQNDENTN